MKKIQNNPLSSEASSGEESEGGIIFLKKAPGLTSFQALGRIKRVLGTRKVGHTGTLDKFAEGLLIILSGKLTRLNALITGMDKSYEALIRFGRETDTLDPEGETIGEAEAPAYGVIEEALSGFLGEIEQTPPLYSAVHIDGQRAHALARKGIDAKVPSRKIKIHRLEIVSYNAPDLRLRIDCSKGTYVRSLARDLGLACGSRAYVEQLKRTAIGPFSLEEAVSAEEFSGPSDFYPWEEFFNRLEIADIAVLNKAGIQAMSHGKPFDLRYVEDSRIFEKSMLILKDETGRLKAILEKKGTRYSYKINLCTS